jgi:hypothetical protein
MSFQSALVNRTPFSAAKHVLPDVEGQETVLIVAAATFDQRTKRLQLADEQCPVRLADEYYGDPAFSSVRYEADIAFEKPLTDLLINGHAYAPGGRAAKTVDVSVLAAEIRKELLVSGDRFLRSGPLGLLPSSPAPFTKMPVIFERAFGGTLESSVEPRNLVGVGFKGARSRNPDIETELPNVEYPHAPASRVGNPQPAGLGVVARSWLPRRKYAGTLDDAWREERWPLLPTDFNVRFYQSAPEDQQSRRLRGGEAVRLMNLTPDGDWRFVLPRLDIPMLCLYDSRRVESALRLDTILIEPDHRRVVMTSRAAITTRRNTGRLREIVLGRVTAGWVRARTTGKRLVSESSAHAPLPTERYYEL